MKTLFKLLIFLVSIYLLSCSEESVTWENKDFGMAVNNYCKYLDSVGYKHNFDYIFVKATTRNDSTLFLIYLCGGSYHFLKEQEEVIDFIQYKGYDILLKGDFPNRIVNIKRNDKLDIIDDIIKERYPKDYEKYVKNNNPVAPLIYDYMDITLIFKGTKLISYKKQSY